MKLSGCPLAPASVGFAQNRWTATGRAPAFELFRIADIETRIIALSANTEIATMPS
jgi:hypothetical protein